MAAVLTVGCSIATSPDSTEQKPALSDGKSDQQPPVGATGAAVNPPGAAGDQIGTAAPLPPAVKKNPVSQEQESTGTDTKTVTDGNDRRDPPRLQFNPPRPVSITQRAGECGKLQEVKIDSELLGKVADDDAVTAEITSSRAGIVFGDDSCSIPLREFSLSKRHASQDIFVRSETSGTFSIGFVGTAQSSTVVIQPLRATALELSAPAEAPVGSCIPISARLVDMFRNPVVDRAPNFSVSVSYAQAYSDSQCSESLASTHPAPDSQGLATFYILGNSSYNAPRIEISDRETHLQSGATIRIAQ